RLQFVARVGRHTDRAQRRSGPAGGSGTAAGETAGSAGLRAVPFFAGAHFSISAGPPDWTGGIRPSESQVLGKSRTHPRAGKKNVARYSAWIRPGRRSD